MIDPANVPAVEADEMLARFVLHRSHIRSNQTVKADAFIPHPYQDLSVTRHLMATEDEIWKFGKGVATQTGKSLYGRADVIAKECLTRQLTVTAVKVDGNPNHADISGWPADKPLQKVIAQEIAAAATYVANPQID